MTSPHLYIKLYKETKWQRFKRKVLRRKNPWSGKPDGSLTNIEPIVFPPATGSETITHISLWDSKEGGQFIGSLNIGEKDS
jgi:hypothetical protein